MNYQSKRAPDVSITRIAGLYALCLIVGGVAVLYALLHAASVAAIAVCALLAGAACAGLAVSTRGLARTLQR